MGRRPRVARVEYIRATASGLASTAPSASAGTAAGGPPRPMASARLAMRCNPTASARRTVGTLRLCSRALPAVTQPRKARS